MPISVFIALSLLLFVGIIGGFIYGYEVGMNDAYKRMERYK